MDSGRKECITKMNCCYRIVVKLFFSWEEGWQLLTVSGPYYSVLNCFRYSRIFDFTALTESQ